MRPQEQYCLTQPARLGLYPHQLRRSWADSKFSNTIFETVSPRMDCQRKQTTYTVKFVFAAGIIISQLNLFEMISIWRYISRYSCD